MRKTKFKKGGLYHIYNRGNRKREVFYSHKDYEKFVFLSRKYSDIFSIEILQRCLMENHYHLILKQKSEHSISKLMHRIGLTYTMYINRKYKLVGHAFQGKFQAKEIKTLRGLATAARYVRLNPVKAGICKEWHQYRWIYTKMTIEEMLERRSTGKLY